MACPRALAGKLRAGARALGGDAPGARDLLAEAVSALDRLEMQMHAAAARGRLRRLVGGVGG